jgi:hypothetical protein
MEVFTAELVKGLTAELQKLYSILRDVRDELVYLREQREREQERAPHTAAGNGAHP